MTKEDIIKMSEMIPKQDSAIWLINPAVMDALNRFDQMPKYKQWLILRWYDIRDLYDKVRGRS